MLFTLSLAHSQLSSTPIPSSFFPCPPRHSTARMLFTLSLRLRKHTARRGAFAAWNHCLAHVLDLANAYVESVIYK
jgi:hypothetical protein